MAVTVLIKRKVAPGNESLLEELYREMRSTALSQKGYIGGETLNRVDVTGEVLIISKWQHIDDWSKWLVSKERRAYQERIDTLTNAETKFEIYIH
ncbi:MAG: antibiotic biosynthesis monooxygenase [Desulfobacula sp.]|uniref:antibiotic biosynthesis monooxygenase family protein n=1 Tax=Desulfobacula sp. TaxID=2593537 RepID=UPI0025C35DB7|nr:antibiotic biosynthesis monooxygenase family protein [Desulfobacula sp.]MCD4719779.1 antibiotic biosynthesis monooxygenase [Desulfobacula sp.]